jgi:diketogulonate reductase-like aldo/keto reductase
MAKTPNVFPIVGGRKVEHLRDNIQALSIKLSDKQIAKLEEASPFTHGFPMNFVGEDPGVVGLENAGGLLKNASQMAVVRSERAIGHE